LKKCPYCAEKIQDEAIVCRFCGRELVPKEVARISEQLITDGDYSPSPEIVASDIEESAKDNKDGAAFQEKSTPRIKQRSDKTTTRPVWKSSLILGAVLATLTAFSTYLEYYNLRINADVFWGRIIFTPPIVLVLGTVLGFVLVPLWRWKKWAPFVLAIVAIVAIWVLQDLFTNFEGISVESLPYYQDALSIVSVKEQASSTSIEKSPTLIPSPKSPQSQKELPLGFIMGTPLYVSEINWEGEDSWEMNLPSIHLQIYWDSRIYYQATFEPGDQEAYTLGKRFYCDVAKINDTDCQFITEAFSQAFEEQRYWVEGEGVRLRSDPSSHCTLWSTRETCILRTIDCCESWINEQTIIAWFY
jgi:hypothetical protein